MMWKRIFNVVPFLAAPAIASACALEVAGLSGTSGAGGATGAGSGSTASANPGPTGDSSTGSTSSGAGGASGSASSGDGATSGASTSGASTSGASTSGASTSSASSGAGGGTTGGCTSLADMAIVMDEETMRQRAQACGGNCLLAGNKASCAKNCMTMATGISDACGTCWGDAIGCSIDKCLLPCFTDPNDTFCKTCTAASCDTAYHACAGL